MAFYGKCIRNEIYNRYYGGNPLKSDEGIPKNPQLNGSSMDESKEFLELFLLDHLIKLLEVYGYYNYFDTTKEEKMIFSGSIHSIVDKVFGNVKILLEKYGNEILDGEFSVEEGKIFSVLKLPLFLILDIFYVVVSHTNVTLTEEKKECYQKLIDLARKANYSNEYHSNWHISEDILRVICGHSNWYIGTLSETSRDKNFKLYPSTIKNYNKLKYGKVSSLEEDDKILSDQTEQLLQYDIEKYPELCCEEILCMGVSNTSFRYEWMKDSDYWVKDLKENRYKGFLIEEQKQEMEEKYDILRKNRDDKIFQKYHNMALCVLPYLHDREFQKFALVETLPWDTDENLKQLQRYLASLYYEYENYCQSKCYKMNFLETIQDRKFLKYSSSSFTIISGLDRLIREELAKQLSDLYLSRKIGFFHSKTVISKEQLCLKLQKLTTVELYQLLDEKKYRLYSKINRLLAISD